MIRTLSVLTLCAALYGCGTKPVAPRFPDAPPELVKQCEQLLQVEAGKNSITDLLEVVVKNYTLYYKCSNRVDGWVEWHKEQTKVWKDIGK